MQKFILNSFKFYEKSVRQYFKLWPFYNSQPCIKNLYSTMHIEPLIDFNKGILQLDINNEICDFPFVWLRDNCQCSECFHSASQSRIIHWKSFNINAIPDSVSSNNEEKLIIKWNDRHESSYKFDWLKKRKFSIENREYFLNNKYRLKKQTWNKQDFFGILNKFDYNSIIHNNTDLKRWLETLAVYGVAIISDAPLAEDSCRNIANRVEFIKKTHYGEEFIVRAKPGTTNVAYLSSNLQLHTDLPYYEYKPGVNLLHCVTQAVGKGGDNLLSDGFYVASQLKKHNGYFYKVLSQTLVDWEDIGKEGQNKFHSLYRSPVICEDMDGEIIRINHSVPQRSSHFNVPIEVIYPWYKSMKAFVDLIYEEAAMYKVSPGEILCFDNKRLLHGRSEYQDTPNNTRYIIGAYLDWDFIYSRLRVL